MIRSDLRLLPAATLIWALAVIGVVAGSGAAVAAAAVVVASALGVILVRRRYASLVMAHLGLVVLAGVLLFPALERNAATDSALGRAAREGAIVELTVVLVGDPEAPSSGPTWSRTGLQTMARTDGGPARVGARVVDLPASVPVLVRSHGDADAVLATVHDGDRVQLRGSLRDADGLLILQARTASPEARAGPAGSAQRLRIALRAQAREATSHLPPDVSALVRGMTSGDTVGMSEGAEEAMRRAGISHLVAVSGANIALVLAAVLIPLLLAGVRRRPRIVIASLVGAVYVWLVGDEPSVQRAATMAAPLLAARFIGVRASPVAALAMTVALWSVIDPVTAASVGFLLSALSTAAILIVAPPLADVIVAASRERIGRIGALVIAVPLVAQLACTPVLVLLTPEVSIWAVPVNMVVGPFVGPSTVIGLLALLVGMVWPTGAQLLNTLAAGGANVVLHTAQLADTLPGSRIAVPEGVIGVLLVLTGLVALAVAIVGRRSAIVRWATAAALVVLITPGIVRLVPVGAGPDWIVAACDVGQGDAVLLRAPPSADARPASTVLIDTGPEPEPLRACLDRLGVRTIDLLVLTHPHADHTGGRGALTGGRTPGEQWICPLPEAARHVVPDAPARVATTGHTWSGPGLDLEVLWPGPDLAVPGGVGTGESDDGANDCSVTVAATWADGTRLIALGDLEPPGQRGLLAASPGAVDVVKVAHHGSRFQEAALYEQLDADLALITVGDDNPFGHPAPDLLRLLSGTAVARTDEHGTLILPAEDPLRPRSVGPGG